MMDLFSRAIKFKSSRKFVRLNRVRDDFEGSAAGYILDASSDFLLLQDADDFSLNGYSIMPLETIKEIRHNPHACFYDKVMSLEGWKKETGDPYTIDLSRWASIFKSLKKTKLTVIVECEAPHLDLFDIGTLKNVGGKSAFMLHYSPAGVIDDVPTRINYHDVMRISFDGRYEKVLSKYVR